MGVVDAVKKGFVKACNLMNVILVFFVFNVVIGLISLPLANPERAGTPGIIAVSVVSSILFFLIFIFLQGGALGLVKDLIKTATASMAQYINYGKKYYLRILGLLLMYILIAIAVVLVLSLISAGILLMGDNLITRTIVALIITIAAVAVITALIYPVYAVVVDDLGAFESLKKGILVAKNNFWKTLGLFMMLLGISLLISLAIGFVVGLVTVPLPEFISRIIITFVNAAVQSFIPIVMMIAFMSFYMTLTAMSEKITPEEPVQPVEGE